MLCAVSQCSSFCRCVVGERCKSSTHGYFQEALTLLDKRWTPYHVQKLKVSVVFRSVLRRLEYQTSHV